jgi:hypothetical protein
LGEKFQIFVTTTKIGKRKSRETPRSQTGDISLILILIFDFFFISILKSVQVLVPKKIFGDKNN